MKRLIDATCERCKNTLSIDGTDRETAEAFAAAHVCPDGVPTTAKLLLTERVVLGPGERLRDSEDPR